MIDLAYAMGPLPGGNSGPASVLIQFVPMIATEVPTGPEVGLRLLMFGPGVEVTVKVMPLLDLPPTVTTTAPVVAPVGTGATMLVPLQLVGVAAVPLKVTVL